MYKSQTFSDLMEKYHEYNKSKIVFEYELARFIEKMCDLFDWNTNVSLMEEKDLIKVECMSPLHTHIWKLNEELFKEKFDLKLIEHKQIIRNGFEVKKEIDLFYYTFKNNKFFDEVKE